MKVAVAIWQNRVSPVFDASRRLCLIEMNEAGEEVGRQEADIGVTVPLQRVPLLTRMEVDVLICGAVSAPLAEWIAAAGIRLIPFAAGDVDDVLDAFRQNRLPSPAYTLPGCGRRRRRRRGRLG